MNEPEVPARDYERARRIEAGEFHPLFKEAVLVRDQPPEIRKDFCKKVYCIVLALFILSFATSSPFVLHVYSAVVFMAEHYKSITSISGILLPMQLILNLSLSISFGHCLGDLPKHYLWLMKTSPWNSLYICLFAMIMGVCVGAHGILLHRWSMLIIFLIAFAVVVLLTTYGFWTGSDYSTSGGAIFIQYLVLLIASVIEIWVHSDVYSRILAGAWILLFARVIVMKTQLIFGTSRGAEQVLEYTIDMYAFVAFELYIIFLFFYLNCIGCFNG